MRFGHMRRRHSSHNWQPPAAETPVKAAQRREADGAQRRAFTGGVAEGTATLVADLHAEALLHHLIHRF